MSNPAAARSKAWVCGRSLAGIVGSNPAGGMDVCCECCVLSEVSASGWSLVQRSPSECGVYECDREPWSMTTPWPTRGCCAMVQKKLDKTGCTICRDGVGATRDGNADTASSTQDVRTVFMEFYRRRMFQYTLQLTFYTLFTITFFF
jgi:hypothetical protein